MPQAIVRRHIRAAKAVFVDVAGTEFWIKVAKSEALALCEHLLWEVDCDDQPEGLYLTAAS